MIFGHTDDNPKPFLWYDTSPTLLLLEHYQGSAYIER